MTSAKTKLIASAVTLAISFVVGAILFGSMIAFFIARGGFLGYGVNMLDVL